MLAKWLIKQTELARQELSADRFVFDKKSEEEIVETSHEETRSVVHCSNNKV